VRTEGIAGRDDTVVWHAAQEAGRFLITQDLDFSDTRKFAPGTHHGLLLVRFHQPGRLALIQKIVEHFRSPDADEWARCFLVLTDHKLRVMRNKTG